MIVDLPNGQTATIADRDSITERQSRAIALAQIIASASAAKLNASGFDNEDPNTWGVFESLSPQEQTAFSDYQATVVVSLVKEWPFGPITHDTVLDLDKKTFDILAEACDKELNGADISAEPDLDPKALTSDSPS